MWLRHHSILTRIERTSTMAMKVIPSQLYLRQCFDYDPMVGVLIWRSRPREHFATERGWKQWNLRFAGAIIATFNGQGYISTSFKETGTLLAHRIIWCWMTGSDPVIFIDHINGDKTDNRWVNLRLATKSQNAVNRKVRIDNRVGFKGVEKHGKKFRAYTGFRGVRCYHGAFSTAEEAHQAYCQAAQKLFGEFAK